MKGRRKKKKGKNSGSFQIKMVTENLQAVGVM